MLAAAAGTENIVRLIINLVGDYAMLAAVDEVRRSINHLFGAHI
jgi:hypothetical protein